MMAGIILQALRHRGIVAVLSVVLLLYGAVLAFQSRLDVLPEFVPPQVTVQTEAPGLAPEQVESLVTRPVEQALSAIPATARVSSESITGLSVVTVVFDDDADILVARQGVAEHLAELAGRLPAGVSVPRMSPLTSSTMDLLKIGLVSQSVSPRELRDLADWELRPRLLAVPGVARITVYGGERREVQILLDDARLAAADLTATDVLTAARAATGVRGSGQIDLESQRIPISTAVIGDAVQVVAQAVVATRGETTIHVADVAQVQEGPAIRRDREALELAGATAEPLRVWVQNWSLASSDTGWQLSAADGAYALLLDVESAGPPVLNGDQGLSRKSAAPGSASYYYSIPRLTARGELRRAGTPLAVTGTAWLDREWGSGALAQDQQGWDWFALQLEDGSALMFYRLRRRDGARDPFSAGTWTDADGRSRHLAATEVAITELDRWQSPRGGSYPARWRLRLEQPHLDLELDPVLADQELDTSPRYWEGVVDVRGRHADRPVIGRGYVELTGYAGDR